MFNENYITAFILLIVIVSFTIGAEFLARRNLLHKEIARKLLHTLAGAIAAAGPFLVRDPALLTAIAAGVSLLTFIAVYFDILPSIHEGEKKSWGIFYFPAAFLILIILFGESAPWVIAVSMSILAFSDSAAAVSGTFLARKYFSLTGDKKSFAGSGLFFIITLTLVYTFFSILDPALIEFAGIDSNDSFVLLAAFNIACILTAFEAISSKGFDNFTVPVAGSLMIYAFFNNGSPDLILNFTIGLLLACAVAFISYRVKFLTLNGSVATFLLAGFIFGFGGWKWSIPIMTFFILSSLLSKMRKNVNKEVEEFFEKSGTRDYMQVLANGGLGGILVLAYQFEAAEIIYYVYIASLAAVCADTWATEIGTLRRTKTYNILDFKPVEQGISGGVSLLGTAGALAGSALIAFSGIFWIGMEHGYYLLLVILSGVFGSLFDSLLGATIQVQHVCNECGKITEKTLHCGAETKYYKGSAWMNNDIVNLIAGAAGGLAILIMTWSLS